MSLRWASFAADAAEFDGSGDDGGEVLEAPGAFAQPAVSEFSLFVDSTVGYLPKRLAEVRTAPLADVAFRGLVLAGLPGAQVQSGEGDELVGGPEGGDGIGFSEEAGGLDGVDPRQRQDVGREFLGELLDLSLEVLANRPEGLQGCEERSDADAGGVRGDWLDSGLEHSIGWGQYEGRKPRA